VQAPSADTGSAASPAGISVSPSGSPAAGENTPSQPATLVSSTNQLDSAPALALPAATVLENMRTTIRSYAAAFGENPVGTNPEITRALSGENPKQINFLKPDGNRVNAKGELIDTWGTPYFFHQISGTEMEIRSAGPDKKMWTADDLVTK
jgi:hypothetical protein